MLIGLIIGLFFGALITVIVIGVLVERGTRRIIDDLGS